MQKLILLLEIRKGESRKVKVEIDKGKGNVRLAFPLSADGWLGVCKKAKGNLQTLNSKDENRNKRSKRTKRL